MRTSWLLLVLAALAGHSASAQQAKRERADRLFDQLAFQAAIPLYEELLESSEDPGLRARLADACRLTENYVCAETWYGSLMTRADADPVYKLYYSQALMANEKYEEAVEWLEEYARQVPSDPRGPNLLKACREREAIVSQSFPAELYPLPFNTARSEIGPAWLDSNTLLFASDRDTILGVRRNNDWYAAPFLDLYTVPLQADGTVSSSKVRSLKGQVNGPLHEGPAQAWNGQVLYLTQSHDKPSAGRENGAASETRSLVKLSIQKALRQERGAWEITRETAIPFNNREYSCAHPSLSADGRSMIFSSDMPGGQGGADLYRAELLADGSAWGTPVNLGPGINTPGDELFPFLHPNGTLFFASDGLPGLGGLDLFEALSEGKAWGVPRNLGKPINSSRDDFGLLWDEKMSSGFLVSNRFGGAGRDDIYGVRQMGIELSGTVYNAFSGEKISGASIRLRQAGLERGRAQTGSDGAYQFAVGTRRTYELLVSAPGHIRRTVPVEVGDLTFPSTVQVDIALEDTLVIKLLVQVLDKDTRSPLPDATVMVYNKCTNQNTEIPGDDEGIMRIRLDPNCTYYLAGRKLGYLDDNDVVSTMGMNESSELASILELTEIREDLVIELKNIYYDYGRYYIREDAVGDLDNLVALMEQYPSLKIELSSHTDSRGTDEFNKGLSQKRAETCVDYLVTKGISRDRLIARGYGEYLLRNHCADGMNCSEEEHQVNRRTEFKVLSFDRVLYSNEVESPAVNLYKSAYGDETPYGVRQGIAEAQGVQPDGNPLIIQRSAGESTDAAEQARRSSSSLLNRQQEVSRSAAAAAVSGEQTTQEDARNRNRRRRRTVVLEPDPQPEPARSNRNAPTDNPARPVILLGADTPERSAGQSTQTAPADRSVENNAVTPPARPAETAADKPAAPSEWWMQGVSYAVQLAFGTSNTSAFSSYADLGTVRAEKKANGTPVVVLGYFVKYSEATAVQQVVRSRGLKDAFVISYVDGQRME